MILCIKNTLTQFQVCNCKNIMLPNGSIKSLSIREKTVVSIRRSIKDTFTQFQMCNFKDLTLPNRSIKLLSIRETNIASIRISIKYAYKDSSV